MIRSGNSQRVGMVETDNTPYHDIASECLFEHCSRISRVFLQEHLLKKEQFILFMRWHLQECHKVGWYHGKQPFHPMIFG
ncbi:hypothetical protein AN964_22060 [Heyndrickxia shackletonii]|uniref:Uncharacterized protein n=1 Tax=Heyndrickxia shackletonii TaxID=157838 RepID=A0A0Q3WRE4_9BACI|nr:hypothetical protein AN964_22060 [Heyndrickxia shackletonii]